MNAIIACPEAPTEEIRCAFGTFSLGTVLVATSIKGVVAILMSDDRDALRRAPADAFPHARLVLDEAGLAETVAQVVVFLEAPHAGLDLPLDIRGSALEQAVWQALRDVPAGQTTTYGQTPRNCRCPPPPRMSARPAPPTCSRSPSHATGWSRRTVRSPAIAGACGAKGS